VGAPDDVDTSCAPGEVDATHVIGMTATSYACGEATMSCPVGADVDGDGATGDDDIASCGKAMADNEELTSTIAIVPFRGRGRGARRGTTW
jgi:hypothetical protein